MLPEPLAVTLQVVDALDEIGARYLIGGSVAGAVHGIVRTTLDTDIVAEMSASQAQPFADALSGTFYLDVETIRRAISHHSSFNVIHLATMFKVDIFLPKGRSFDRRQMERRQAWVVDPESGRSVYVASPEDTVLAKLEWFRAGEEVSDRQWQDILGVLGVQKGRLDLDYLRLWAEALGVADLLERAVSQVSPL